jgi:RNA polymerase sigma-70 factor, ECF subfamily
LSEPFPGRFRLYLPVSELDLLLSRCRQGDALAWEALVRRYQARIYGFALHYLRDPEDARDAAQDVFIKMYRHLGTFRDGRTFVPWMLRLARNGCIDRIRSRQARPHDCPVSAGEAAEHASLAPSPEDSLLEEARRSLLYRALETLTAANREIVQLKDLEQLKLEDISTRLGLPLGTVKSRSNRARGELAKAVRSLAAAAEAVP